MDWHNRYQTQAAWTQTLRKHLVDTRVSLSPQSKVLEIGCGTGVITKWFHEQYNSQLFGLDFNYSSIILATRNNRIISYYVSDAQDVPFAPCIFDLVFCHYFLLWLSTPILALRECMRTLKPGGKFIAFAEPDYLARIDYPPSLERLGALQTHSLIRQGVNPSAGRHLADWLNQSGFTGITFGIIGHEDVPTGVPEWLESEHEVIQNDLGRELPAAEFNSLLDEDTAAWKNGSRLLFVPTFYAVATKPDD